MREIPRGIAGAKKPGLESQKLNRRTNTFNATKTREAEAVSGTAAVVVVAVEVVEEGVIEEARLRPEKRK